MPLNTLVAPAIIVWHDQSNVTNEEIQNQPCNVEKIFVKVQWATNDTLTRCVAILFHSRIKQCSPIKYNTLPVN